MPSYNYKCKEHGSFEVFASMNDVKRTEDCPECGASCKRHWKKDKSFVLWKGPGANGMSDSGYYHNPNIKEVEDEMFENIKEMADDGDL